LLTFLTSCSGTHQAYLRTLKLAFAETEDIVLQTNDITQSPADLIYVKKGDSPTVVLALAFIEDGQYKWISADKVVLIEQNGRLVKTLALEQNLDFVYAETTDPLIDPSKLSDDVSWYRQIDFADIFFGVAVKSIFVNKGVQHLNIQKHSIETILIEEQVVVSNTAKHSFNEKNWSNQFWVSKDSGKIIRSKQKLVPGGDVFDIIYVSRALRL
jgi:hypothetical protein